MLPQHRLLFFCLTPTKGEAVNLLKNKKFEVRMLEDVTMNEAAQIKEQLLLDPDAPAIRHILIDQVSEHANEFVTKTAVTIGLVYAGTRIVKSLCKIAEIAAKARL